MEDTAEIALRFTSGALGSIHLDYLQRPASHWLEIIGTLGTLRWDNADGIVRLTRVELRKIKQSLSRNSTRQKALSAIGCSWMSCVTSVMCLMGNAEPVCTLQDGIQSLRLSLIALCILTTGR